MHLTPKKQCLCEESKDDVRRTTSCCSNSSDADSDDSAVKSAGSARPTNIPQRIPLCLEPITTRNRVMRMEERVRTLSKQNDRVHPGINFSYQVVPFFFHC